MSFAFIAEHSEGTSGMVAISKLRDLIDMVRWVTFRLPKSVGSERFLEWAKWTQDIAAYRDRRERTRMQDPDGDVMDDHVYHVLDNARAKCNGLLKPSP